MIWIIVIILAVLVDQITKFIVASNIKDGSHIAVINNFFYIASSRNKGAAWGIMQNGRYFFIVITLIVLVVLAKILKDNKNPVLRTAVSLIIGGAAGNLIDRIRTGSVVDFLDFYFGSYNFPTFNAADTCVVVGTILLAYYIMFVYKEKKVEA